MHIPTRWWCYRLVKTYTPINTALENINEENTLKMINEDYTGSYIYKRRKEILEIKKALAKDILQHNFKYYKNFVVINDKTYNGWTKAMIDDIVKDIVKESQHSEVNINIEDFEFEEI